MSKPLPHPAKRPPKALVPTASRMLTATEFHRLADVPAVLEWLANAAKKKARKRNNENPEKPPSPGGGDSGNNTP